MDKIKKYIPWVLRILALAYLGLYMSSNIMTFITYIFLHADLQDLFINELYEIPLFVATVLFVVHIFFEYKKKQTKLLFASYIALAAYQALMLVLNLYVVFRNCAYITDSAYMTMVLTRNLLSLIPTSGILVHVVLAIMCIRGEWKNVMSTRISLAVWAGTWLFIGIPNGLSVVSDNLRYANFLTGAFVILSFLMTIITAVLNLVLRATYWCVGDNPYEVTKEAGISVSELESKLTTLKELYDLGEISEAEFTAQKAELLAKF